MRPDHDYDAWLDEQFRELVEADEQEPPQQQLSTKLREVHERVRNRRWHKEDSFSIAV